MNVRHVLSALSPRKLSQKLILSFTVAMTVVGAIASYVHVKTQERQLIDVMMTGADQLSGSITSATWHAMLADQREDAYQTMNTIAQKQGISRIRIFNKEGRIMFSTEAGDNGIVDKAAEACYICHAAEQPLVRVDMPTRARIYRSVTGNRRLGMITPIYNEASCSSADCHAHPKGVSVLGVLDISFTLEQLDSEVASIRLRVVLISLAVVLISAIISLVFVRRYLDGPIQHLIEGTRAVSAMQLDQPIAIDTSEELAELGKSFDSMRLRLKDALEEINQFTQGLETTVQERTEQLRIANQKLLQSDRLASLGQLSASVAHEINNPLSGVLNLSMLMQRIMKDDGVPKERIPDFRQHLTQVINETARVGRIVQDLLAFSRRSKTQRSHADFNGMITTTVNLIRHKLKLMSVDIDLELDPNIPMLTCDSSQLQQVVINLVMNAAEASQNKMPGRVRLTTTLTPDKKWTIMRIEDNGDGIPQENLAKIFDPFFTTKGEGKGVGLGLAVVYGIIESHRGDIDVKSTVGTGTTFTVTLPVDETKPDKVG